METLYEFVKYYISWNMILEQPRKHGFSQGVLYRLLTLCMMLILSGFFCVLVPSQLEEGDPVIFSSSYMEDPAMLVVSRTAETDLSQHKVERMIRVKSSSSPRVERAADASSSQQQQQQHQQQQQVDDVVVVATGGVLDTSSQGEQDKMSCSSSEEKISSSSSSSSSTLPMMTFDQTSSDQDKQELNNTTLRSEKSTTLRGRETDDNTDGRMKQNVQRSPQVVSNLLFDLTHVLQSMMEHSIQFAQKLVQNYGEVTKLMQRVTETNKLLEEPRENKNDGNEGKEEEFIMEGNNNNKEQLIEGFVKMEESIGCKKSSASCKVDSDCCHASSYDKHRLKCYNGRCCRPAGSHCNSSYECCRNMACMRPKNMAGGGIFVRICIPRTSSTWH